MSQFNSNGHLALLDPGGALRARIHFKLRLLFFLVGNMLFYYLTFIILGIDSF